MKQTNKEQTKHPSQIIPPFLAPLLELDLAVCVLPIRAEKALRPTEVVPAVRSCLGAILKQRFCPYADYGKRRCSQCERQQGCCYTLLFSPFGGESHDEAGPKKGRAGDLPRPYALHLPLGPGKREIAPGEAAVLELTLIGKEAAAFRRPMMESVFQAVLGLGLRFSLSPGIWHSVMPRQAGDGSRQLVCGRGSQVLEGPCRAALSHWIEAMPPWATGRGPGQLLELRFTSPLQMKRGHQGFAFPAFVKTILARLRDLKRHYGGDTHMGELPRDFFTQASDIEVFSNLARAEASWFSSHRKKSIDLGGWEGALILKGELARFIPLVAAGFLLGIGSKTVYGLGRFDLPGWEFWPGGCALESSLSA